MVTARMRVKQLPWLVNWFPLNDFYSGKEWKVVRVPFAALGITPADVFEAMGYGQNRPDAETERLIARLIPSFESAEHLYCFRMFDGKTDKRTIEVGGQTFDTGTTVAAVMRGAERFAVFVATAGKDYEQRRDALKAEGDILS